MKLTLRPLTPLWTGNNEGVSNQLRVTGLMGSLRWWFEGLVRAKGLYACDPSAGGCVYGEGEICAACRIFGTTGWSRRFRLSASGLGPEPWYVIANAPVARMHEGWLTRIYKPESKVLWGSELELLFTRYLSKIAEGEWERTEKVLTGLVTLVARFGAIGAKAQNGLGAVELTSSTEGSREAVREFFAQSHPPQREDRNPGWFNLARTVFLTFEVANPSDYMRSAVRIPATGKAKYDGLVLPVAYDIRYKRSSKDFRKGTGQDVGLRPLLKEFFRSREENVEDLVGSTARSRERTASRVFVTHRYRKNLTEKFRFRVWAHVPEGWNAEPRVIGQTIHTYVTKYY